MNSTVEQELDQKGWCLVRTRGRSMEPMLHEHISSVRLAKGEGRPRKWDVALYLRGDGVMVLHRVIRVLEDEYIFCGDNTVALEHVRPEQILGTVDGFFPDETERYIAADSPEYRRYYRAWTLKWLWRRAYRFGSRVKRGVLKVLKKK